MSRIAALCLLLIMLTCATGCWTYDPVHNQGIWRMIRRDLQIIHEDLDFMMAVDKPSHAARSDY